ncbi:SCO7613 C-terminal domain-containing membrane protein [Blastococcus sp. SYSU D00922]
MTSVDRTVGTAPLPPLPYRARPAQVLLGVGAVLLVSAGAAVASAYGGGPVRVLLLVLAAGTAWFSVRAARTGLRSSEETLAASTAGLALAGSDLGAPVLGGAPGWAALLAAGFLGLHRVAPTTASWPLASWAAAQLAVLRAFDVVPDALETTVLLGVALVGLGIALFGRRAVAQVALVTTAPWWLAGVVGGSSSAWNGAGGERWLSAALMVAAAAGLLVTRLRAELEPLTGPPVAIPVVAGVVAGAAVTGAFSSLGTLAMTLTGYAGVLLANTAAAVLTGWRRGLLLPVALSAGTVMALFSVVQLVGLERWSELSLLLLLTALPTVLVAARRPDDRPVALPTAIGCLAGAALLALPDRLLGPVAVGVLLTVLYCVAMTVGAGLDASSRSATARAAALCSLAAATLLRVEHHRTTLAVLLAVQGVFTLTWAWRTHVPGDPLHPTSATAWRGGAVQLVAAGWFFAAAADLAAVEWYSLPAAIGLLVAAGPRLVDGPSWPAWGPGLLTAAVPSAVLAVTTSDGDRAVWVLLAAAAVLVAGARTGLRAPLMVGAGTVLFLGLGFTVRALPWPLATALVVGCALLALGMRRERRPVAGFGARLADLR